MSGQEFLYYAEWCGPTDDQAELVEVKPDDPAKPVANQCAKTPPEEWRKLATRQLSTAAAALSFDDSRPEITHREMVRAKIAIDLYFRSWTKAIEQDT